MEITSCLNRTSLPSCQAEQGGRAGTKKYLPPRHKDTKDFMRRKKFCHKKHKINN